MGKPLIGDNYVDLCGLEPTTPIKTPSAAPLNDLSISETEAWSYAGAPEQCCAPARASAGSVAEVSTAPSEASPRFQEAGLGGFRVSEVKASAGLV